MDIAKVQNELDASKAAGRTLEKTISELNFSLSEQNSELRKLRTELDETKDANSREIQGAKLDAQKEGEHQLHQLQITIEEKERIIAELKTKEWESKDFETQRLYKEIAALQSKLETRNAAANNFRKQFLELQLELSANLDKVVAFPLPSLTVISGSWGWWNLANRRGPEQAYHRTWGRTPVDGG